MIIGFKVLLILSLFLISTIDSFFKKRCLKYKEMKQWKDDDTVTIIDVRKPHIYVANWHFNRSINIPVYELRDALTMSNNSFRYIYRRDLPLLTSKIVFTKYKGYTRRAVKIAKSKNFKNVYSYCGGYKEWIKKKTKLLQCR